MNYSESSIIKNLGPNPLFLDSRHYTALAFILAVCIPQTTHGSALRYGLLLLQIGSAVQAFFAPPPPVLDVALLYTSGVFMGNMLARYIDRLYIHTPETSFYRVQNVSSSSITPPKLEDISNTPLSARIFWAFELISVTRGIGWNWRVAGIPKPSVASTRFQFAASQLLRWVAMYTGLNLVTLACRTILSNPNPSLNIPGDLHIHILIVVGFITTIYSHFAILILPLSAICVGLQVGPRSWREVSSWPPNFGSITEAYSIRRFWGYTWHQQLRRQTGVPGSYLLGLLPESVRVSRRTPVRLARRYFLHIMSFVVSGAIHACGTYQVTRAFGTPLWDGGKMRYFLVQGVAIIIEDFVCWVLGVDDRSGAKPTTMRRWMGYAITVSWYVCTRVYVLAIPVALSCGIRDEREDIYAALELARRSAAAVPGNFVAQAWELFL
ncbi:hypothetical protein N7520_003632 [Penicillium odoratum]|uniref:uncharacterized protein n=1 Tax=Penicillium odoratum TaxID=1167516 RepID=UPI00254762A8|nr:uncharacterized protein N7520_003632 [Penicillium odoratum]KAJ5769073.1 hypothetical protein N7520_003632 [Penicillium odoratum]